MHVFIPLFPKGITEMQFFNLLPSRKHPLCILANSCQYILIPITHFSRPAPLFR